MRRQDWLMIALWCVACLAVLYLTACASSPSHNAAGGYVDACGDLPGLLGDDC
jgi:hypothetical protein